MAGDCPLTEVLRRDGRVWLRGALSEIDLAPFDAAAGQGLLRPGQRLGGITALDRGAALSGLIGGLMPGARATRMVAFNKTEGVNWGVSWHQDRIIAVAARHEVPGFGKWTEKAGQWHCEPPLGVLEAMLFVRLHLDANTADNGAMEIALGSHTEGFIAERAAEERAASCQTEICEARRGDVLVMHMLILHRSRPATVASSRRVLRIDYSASDLPEPLAWAI